MENLWKDADAEQLVSDHAARGIGKDLALRVYTTRLLGGVPQLVLHGGGNTSVKTAATDMVGETHRVLCVKGSGWDMGVIEAPGLPAVKLDPLLKARAFESLGDEDMVKLQRANLIDPSSPNPSVETLLHAFLPHKFVDHTHSTAVLALVDQENSEEICQEVYGDTFGFVPYIMPGFDLAKAAAEVYEQNPEVEGLILDKHGLFTFGEGARSAYDRMIEAVNKAEAYVEAKARVNRLPAASLPSSIAEPVEVLPIVRGAVAHDKGAGHYTRFVADFRTNDAIREFVDGAGLAEYANRGVPTPDLSIRIKYGPVILPAPERGRLDGFKSGVEAAVADFVAGYVRYFEENNAADDIDRIMLDPMPRLAMLPGFGLIGFGTSKKAASVAADVGENFITSIAAAEKFGRFQPLTFDELFKLEYWSLEQAKLAGARSLPLSGQVVFVTGGGGAIGAATAKVFAEQGAHAVVADLDAEAAQRSAHAAGNGALGVACDVTDPASVAAAFDAAVERFGGVDIVVSNAGAAWEGGIGELDDALLRKSFELNFFAHQSVAQKAVAIFKAQGTGGCLLFNTSKQAINPGANFGAYGLPKAATLFLSRQYALEYGHLGIRSNAVNADRIRSGLLDDAMIANRAKARGVSTADYMAGNLLKQEVTARDVAEAFLSQALAERTTGNVTTVDGGNIAAALR